MVDVALLKRLRSETLAGIADCRKALEETKGDYKKAVEWIRAKGLEKAAKKSDRETSQGLIESYIHQNGRVGALVEVLCETDFVARTDVFKNLVHEICMQAAAMNPKDVKALLAQDYIRDGSKKVEDLVKEAIAKLGENIVIKKLQRFEIGE
ncbi:MAG: translation elongation factor Ts [Candidatus Levybacteria bacterium]|nr:translation elongation factor Ts [Candidatus Levybacteria bacterium]MDZ4227764.1 translation elongation factor Ts [Candidatus Levybacteria bacterium]